MPRESIHYDIPDGWSKQIIENHNVSYYSYHVNGWIERESFMTIPTLV